MKPVRVVLSPEAEEAYDLLNQNARDEASLLNAIHKKIELIKSNPHYGEPVSKRLIPREYRERYGITNLFRVELPRFWRMLYTLTNGESEIEIIAFVLDVIDHRQYDRKSGYRRR